MDGEKYSSGKSIRRGKVFVGEIVFVGEKYSSGKSIRRGKIFVGEKYSSGKNIRWGKIFVGERFRQIVDNFVNFPRRIFPEKG